MKLAALLGTIAVVWCVLGALVLGPGILVYPAAWAAVFAVLYAIHKAVNFFNAQNGHRAVARARSSTELSRDQSAALAR